MSPSTALCSLSHRAAESIWATGWPGFEAHLHGTAYLQFHPYKNQQQPPVVADMILPLAADSTGGTATLSGTQLAKTFSLPTNIEKAYLDVDAHSQNDDEWWYECVPRCSHLPA